MTSDRPTGQPLVAPTSTQNLNPTAPVFCQGGQDKGAQNSFSADVSEKEFSKEFKDVNIGQPLTNGDVHASNSSAGNYFASSRGWAVSQPYQQPRMHSQGAQSSAVLGMNMGHTPLVSSGQANQNGQQGFSLGLPAATEALVSTSFAVPDGGGGDPPDQQGSSANDGNPGENSDADTGAGSGAGNEGDAAEEDLPFPEEAIAPIRRQLEYYFSQENLPHDKYLNTHMDINKYVPLRLFPDFNRMKPICSGVDQLVQAVQTSSVLELNEDKTKVRISQTRKTLTLRGLPPKATQEDIVKLLKDNECPAAIHIEVIMVHTVSNWYVSFSTEAQCMEAFFKLHNSKVSVDGYPIGCCIKSSGTHVATGYFATPQNDEHPQRRIPQSQASVTAPLQGSMTQQPALQTQQALVQPYNPLHLHPSLMTPAGQGLYFSQGTQYLNMNVPSYVPGVITQSWPGTAGLDPGLMLQNSGLQPQQIRTPLPRPMVQGAGSHRFPRAQRPNRQAMDRSNVSQVSVSGTASRNSPRTMDGSVQSNMVPHSASHMSRRSNVRDDISVTQHAGSHHQFVTPIATQVTGVPSTTAIVNPTAMEGVTNTASLTHNAVNAHAMPQQQAQAQQGPTHQQSVLLQQTTMSGGNAVAPNSIAQHHHHHHHHQHHHQQPPPQMPLQLPQPQQQAQHSTQHPQGHHHAHHHHTHHAHHNSHHGQQQHLGAAHPQQPSQLPQSVGHQHQQPTLASAHPHPQPGHHQHQPHHHHHHHHHHQSQAMLQSQHHHQPPPGERRSLVMPPQQPPPQAHHHQQNAPLGNRRNRRRRDETAGRNQRDRNTTGRSNFSSQAPAAADNFTMEANSFPPLPGAANAPSSEITPENRMMHSDIVKGISRVPSIGSGAPLPIRGNSSSTPSPVATPTLTPFHVPSAGPAVVDIRGGEEIDQIVDDDTTSSSQEEADVDVSSVEPVASSNRPTRCDVAVPAAAESVSAQSRHMKGSAPVTSPNPGAHLRQGHNQHAMPLQQMATQQTAMPLMAPVSTLPSADSPKLSYAQILLAQKKREAAAAESNANAVAATTAANATNSAVTSGSQVSMNGPNTPAGVPAAIQPNPTRVGPASNNAFRDQGNYPVNPSHRPAAHRSPKDGQPRPEGPRMPNGRRNSKENRTQGNPGKFDRKKPDGRK